MAKAASGKDTRTRTRQKKELEFDFIKSNSFRVIHADGAFGGIAPNGNIHMALYSERRPIPTKMVHSIEGGDLGPEIKSRRQERNALVREVEVDVVLSHLHAVSLRDWLTDKIEALNQLTAKEVVEEQPTAAKPKTRKSKSDAKRKVPNK